MHIYELRPFLVQSLQLFFKLSEPSPVPAPHGGTVIEWLVEDGDPVSPGQPLVRLHPEGVTP